MLKPHKRITKRHLKEDKFVTYYFKAVDYVETNSRQILIGVGTLLAISIAMFAYSRNQASKESAAVVELAKATQEYANANYEGATVVFKNLIDKYGNTKSGKMARFYLANAYFELKNYAEAEKNYGDFSDDSDDDVLAASALSGVAACLEEQAKFDEAAQVYQKTAEKFPEAFIAAENLYHSARCYMLSGKRQEALATLNRLLERFPDSPVKADAELLLAELSS